MKISLVIPAYNEEKYIGECLDSAIKNSGGKFFEIIVVDNASADRTREVAEKRSGVRVVREKEKSLTKARQRGLLEAKGDYLAYIDADTRMHENWFGRAEKFFDENPTAVSLSGPYRYYDGSKFNNIIMAGIWGFSAPVARALAGYALLGGNFIARRDKLLEMGGFDSSIEFYGEDTDIARRLSKFGSVDFKMDFYIYSSSRRLKKEGLLKANFIYAMNFIWQAIFHRPFTKTHNDIRT